MNHLVSQGDHLLVTTLAKTRLSSMLPWAAPWVREAMVREAMRPASTAARRAGDRGEPAGKSFDELRVQAYAALPARRHPAQPATAVLRASPRRAARADDLSSAGSLLFSAARAFSAAGAPPRLGLTAGSIRRSLSTGATATSSSDGRAECFQTLRGLAYAAVPVRRPRRLLSSAQQGRRASSAASSGQRLDTQVFSAGHIMAPAVGSVQDYCLEDKLAGLTNLRTSRGLHRAGAFTDAIIAAEQAVSLPDSGTISGGAVHWQAWHLIGTANAHLDKLPEAVKALEIATGLWERLEVSHDPARNAPRLYHSHAVALARQQRLPEAIGQFHQAIALHIDGESTMALHIDGESTAGNLQLADHYLALGGVLGKLGRSGEQLHAYQQAETATAFSAEEPSPESEETPAAAELAGLEQAAGLSAAARRREFQIALAGQSEARPSFVTATC